MSAAIIEIQPRSTALLTGVPSREANHSFQKWLTQRTNRSAFQMEPQHSPQADQLKSQVYLVYSEWGPDLRIPRPERLASVFPDIDEATRTAWMAEFDDVDEAIYRYAETGAVRLRSREDFLHHMAAEFPFMDDEALGSAWARVVFYTVHEGF